MPKVIQRNKSAIFQNEIGYEVDFLLVVRHTKIHLFDSIHLYGSGQAHLGMPKVIPNNKFLLCQN